MLDGSKARRVLTKSPPTLKRGIGCYLCAARLEVAAEKERAMGVALQVLADRTVSLSTFIIVRPVRSRLVESGVA